MPHTSDIRVLGYEPLLAPSALLAELPLGAREAKHVEQARAGRGAHDSAHECHQRPPTTAKPKQCFRRSGGVEWR